MIIVSNMGSTTVHKVAQKRTPQRGVLSPPLWNLAANTLLDSAKVKCVAYLDDIALV